MKTLVIDVGGSKVKLAIGTNPIGEFNSGEKHTPQDFLTQVKAIVYGHKYDKVVIGVPAVCKRNGNHDVIVTKPANLGKGWAGFDFRGHFGIKDEELNLRVINDATMQAIGFIPAMLGSDPTPDRVLFLGLGTGLGSAILKQTNDGFGGVIALPLETGHMPYKSGKSFEHYVGRAGLERLGKKKWKKHVLKVVEILKASYLADKVLLGGGNAQLFSGDDMPDYVLLGGNAMAFAGGAILDFKHGI